MGIPRGIQLTRAAHCTLAQLYCMRWSGYDTIVLPSIVYMQRAGI
jgi:hypothetical protein